MANTVNVQNLVHTYIKEHNLSAQGINYNNLKLTLDPPAWNQTNLDVGIKMPKKVINVKAENTKSILTVISHAQSFLEINSGIMAGNDNGSTMENQIKCPQEIGGIMATIDLSKPLRQPIYSPNITCDDWLRWKGTGICQIKPVYTMYRGWFRTIARLSGNVRVEGNQLPIEEIARDLGVPKPFFLDDQSLCWYVIGTAEIILENINSIVAR